MSDVFHCFGNSHVWLFNGDLKSFPPKEQRLSHFRTHHLGPVTGWAFTDKHLPKVLETLSRERIATGSKVVLCVGEVDCRWHLPLQASKQKRSVESVVAECIDRYFESFIILRDKGYSMYAWGTHPTTTGGHDDSPSSPVYGNVEERNKTCVEWNQKLKAKCVENGVAFVSIYDSLVDANNITKMEYFRDYCHLNNKCLPLVLEAFGVQ